MLRITCLVVVLLCVGVSALRAEEAALLRDCDMSLVALQPGDMLAFSSGALHFASNGAAVIWRVEILVGTGNMELRVAAN